MAFTNPLALDSQVCFALYSGEKATAAAYRDLLKPLGLTYAQYLVMLSLWEEDGPSVSTLGRRLGLGSGTLSRLLEPLEVAGRLQRRRDLADERVVGVHLTDDGVRHFEPKRCPSRKDSSRGWVSNRRRRRS